MFTPILGDLAAVTALAAPLDALWQLVLALGIGMIGYRVAKRVIGRF